MEQGSGGLHDMHSTFREWFEAIRDHIRQHVDFASAGDFERMHSTLMVICDEALGLEFESAKERRLRHPSQSWLVARTATGAGWKSAADEVFWLEIHLLKREGLDGITVVGVGPRHGTAERLCRQLRLIDEPMAKHLEGVVEIGVACGFGVVEWSSVQTTSLIRRRWRRCLRR